MITSVSRHIIILSLILVWASSGGLQFVAHSAVGSQSTFQGEQNQDLKQRAIEELVHSQERDTIRRDHTVPISLRIYSYHVALDAIDTSVKPNDQTANRASSLLIYQKNSLYLI
jgi:hypothetical protein